MSSLFRWQTISFLSRFFAMVVGLIQSVIIVRILTPAEYGLVGIVTAIGNLTGAFKHLGLVSATTREIAGCEKDEDASQIFASALLIRATVSIPLVVGLFFLADYLAGQVYHQPIIAGPIRIFAGIVLLQSFQELCNAVLAGRKRFKAIFSFQAIIALVSLVFYLPLVYYFKVNGYFWAMLGLTVTSAVVLTLLAFRAFGWRLVWPRGQELRGLVRSLLGLGLVIYFGKVLYMLWQKMGPLYLGTRVSLAEVGFFSFAAMYTMKILIVSDAVTDVNLPVMTDNLKKGIEEFRARFLTNFHKIYALMLLGGTVAIFWSRDIFHLLVKTKYDSSLELVPPLLLAFFLYGLLNLLDSSVLVPAKYLKEIVIYHLFLVLGTGLFLVAGFSPNPLLAVAWAMAFGGLLAFVYLSFVCQRKDLRLWGRELGFLTAAAFPVLTANFLVVGFWWRAGAFLVFLIFYLWLVPYLKVLSWRRFFGR